MLHTLRKRKALQKGKGVAVPFFFHQKNGQRLSQNAVRNVFKNVLRKAGLRDLRGFTIPATPLPAYY